MNLHRYPGSCMNSERRLSLTRGGFLRRPYRGSWNGPNMKDYATRDKYAEQSSVERRHCSAIATPTLRAAQTQRQYDATPHRCSLRPKPRSHFVELWRHCSSKWMIRCVGLNFCGTKLLWMAIKPQKTERLVPRKLRSIQYTISNLKYMLYVYTATMHPHDCSIGMV